MKLQFLIYLSLFAMILISCEKEIPFDDPGADPRVVIGAFLSPQDNEISLELTKSESILSDPEFEFLSEANVELYENDIFLGTMDNTVDGIYTFNQPSVPGKEYRVKVNYPGLDPVEAQTIVPENLTNAQVSVITENDIEQYSQRITLSFDDDPNKKDYYHILLYFAYEMEPQEYLLGWTTNNEILRNIDSGSGESDFYHLENAQFSDELFNGNNVSITIESNNYIEGADVILRIMHVSEDYFLYRSSVQLQLETGDNPFAQPVPVHTNVESGYGIFCSYNYQDFIIE